jgi:hypothetical protein
MSANNAQKLEEEKTTLEGMVESRDELIMEIARETGLDRMGEDAEDEDEDEYADDGGDATAPPVPAPPAAALEEIDDEGFVEMVPKQEAPVAHQIILADAEPEMLQPCLHHALMRDYEDSRPRMVENLYDLDDEPNDDHFDMDEWFLKDGSNDRDCLI